jgi:hypothetical protein
MKEELQNILEKLQNESNFFSLERECPHIIKAPKMFCSTTFGRLHPLAHPTCGLTQQNILHYYHELGHSIRLTIAIHDVIDYSFMWFPKIHACTEDLQECQHNLLGLLSFDKK